MPGAERQASVLTQASRLLTVALFFYRTDISVMATPSSNVKQIASEFSQMLNNNLNQC